MGAVGGERSIQDALEKLAPLGADQPLDRLSVLKEKRPEVRWRVSACATVRVTRDLGPISDYAWSVAVISP